MSTFNQIFSAEEQANMDAETRAHVQSMCALNDQMNAQFRDALFLGYLADDETVASAANQESVKGGAR